MTRPLTPAELQLLAHLSDGRAAASDIDPDVIRGLERDGLVQPRLGGWRVSTKGALAAMGAPLC
jgi:hypothetical protein